jgi:hypothetical protein
VRGTRTSDGLPLRPLSLGELLDAAVALLRAHAVPLLALAVPLAALEQLALVPLRRAAGLTMPWELPDPEHTGSWWVLTATGFGTEAAIIAVLGSVAAAAAGPALVGVDVRGRQLWRRVRPFATLVAAALVGAVTALSAFLLFVPWLFVFGMLALVTPALVTDRVGNPFSAVARSLRLTGHAGMRASWLRVAAYLSWLVIRITLGVGWFQVLQLVTPTRPDWVPVLSAAASLVADVLAYTALACFDAVLHLETRIRAEGLDLSVDRARRLGADPLLELPVRR